MYCCIECGHVFDEDEIVAWKESRGEYWGTPCSELISGCPKCKGDYVETYRCSVCNEWITDEYVKLNNGKRICDNCYVVYDLGDE
jgi:hypothetical protein